MAALGYREVKVVSETAKYDPQVPSEQIEKLAATFDGMPVMFEGRRIGTIRDVTVDGDTISGYVEPFRRKGEKTTITFSSRPAFNIWDVVTTETTEAPDDPVLVDARDRGV